MKCFDQKHEYINESPIELRDFVRLISNIYDHTFYLRAY